VVRSVINGRLRIEPRTEHGNRLEEYLNHATNVLERKTFHGVEQDSLRRIIRAFDKVLGEDEIALLLTQLKGVRRQVVKKVERLITSPSTPNDVSTNEDFDAFLSHHSKDNKNQSCGNWLTHSSPGDCGPGWTNASCPPEGRGKMAWKPSSKLQKQQL
jgi:hypothetical protein